MKKIIFALFGILSFLTIANSQSTNLDGYAYGYNTTTLNSGGYGTWSFYVSANSLGVFTLKNTSNSSDVDLYVYSDFNLTQKLGSGTLSGTGTEIVIIPPETYNRRIYIKVVNAGNTGSNYRIYPHEVDVWSVFFVELLKNLLFCSEDADQDELTSAVGDLLFSLLTEDSMEGMTRNVLIGQVTSAIRNEFGYGCVGDFMIGFLVQTVDKIYKNYW